MDTEVYFENIAASILEQLDDAVRSIRLAVAWFTDRQLFDVLLQKASEGVAVIVIIRNDVINLGQAGLEWQKFLDANGTLYFSPNNPALHHKFCLIDDSVLLSGSYNWTYGAKRNRENMLVTQQKEVVQAFRGEFKFLLKDALEVINLAETVLSHPPEVNVEIRQQAAVEKALGAEDQQQQQVEDEYEVLLQESWDAYRQKDYQEAEVIAKKAIKLYSTKPEAHQILADVYWRTNQNQKAIDAARKAEELGVQDTRLWNTYGLAYDGLKRHKEAITYYDRCIKKEPETTTWYHNKCFALIAFGSEKEGDKVALAGMEVARNEIKRVKADSSSYRLMRIYLELGALKTDGSMARANARLAQELYNDLPEEEQDLHDLDDINGLLKRK